MSRVEHAEYVEGAVTAVKFVQTPPPAGLPFGSSHLEVTIRIPYTGRPVRLCDTAWLGLAGWGAARPLGTPDGEPR